MRLRVEVSNLEVRAQLAERRQDYQLPRPGHHWLMLEGPGVLVGNVHGVEANLHRRINVTAGAVADHPAVGFHDFVLVHQPAVRLRIFFRHDLNELEKSLQAGAFDLRGLLRGFAFGEENEPVPLG